MTDLIRFYGCYFIADYEREVFLMIDIPNGVIRHIGIDEFNIIELLSDIKNGLNDIK